MATPLYALAFLDELAQRLLRNDQMRFTCHARASLATTNLIGISRVIRSRLNICRGTDGRVLPRPGDAIPPAGCFTRRSLPPIYIRDTTAPLTADRSATENDPENGPPTERDHSTRPETEREQEDQDIIESDHLIQEPPSDSGWTPGLIPARALGKQPNRQTDSQLVTVSQSFKILGGLHGC